MPKFSKKAKHHAAYSAADKRRQIKRSQQASPVKVSYLPGFGPPDDGMGEYRKTKFPFRATINGEVALVHADLSVEYVEEEDIAWME